MPGKVDATEFEDVLREETRKFRGRVFVLRERTMAEYEKLTKLATTKEVDQETGRVEERFDSQLHSRLLLNACIVSATPPMPRDGIAGLGTAVVSALNRIVERLHYLDEKDELDERDGKPADGEEEGKGNAAS